MKNYKQDI